MNGTGSETPGVPALDSVAVGSVTVATSGPVESETPPAAPAAAGSETVVMSGDVPRETPPGDTTAAGRLTAVMNGSAASVASPLTGVAERNPYRRIPRWWTGR